MRCRRVERLLSDYIDGCLSGKMREGVEEHIARCDSCSAALRRLEATLRLIRIKVAETPPDAYWAYFWPRLRKRMEEGGRVEIGEGLPEGALVTRFLAPLAAFAAIVMASLFVFNTLMFRTGGRGEEAGPARGTMSSRREELASRLARQVEDTVEGYGMKGLPGDFPFQAARREGDVVFGGTGVSGGIDRFVLHPASLQGTSPAQPPVHYVLKQASRPIPEGPCQFFY